MARVKTFINDGSLLPGDLNSLQDEYEHAFASYKTLARGSYRFDAPGAGTFLLGENLGSGGGRTASSSEGGIVAIHLDPADYAAGARVVKGRIRASALVNATAPAANYTVGLYPVTAAAGAAGVVSVTLGTLVAGTTVALTGLAAGSLNQVGSGDFNLPAAGWYALGVVTSAASAAGSSVAVRAALQLRQV